MIESKKLLNTLVSRLLPVYEEGEARSIVFILLEHTTQLSRTNILANKMIPESFDNAFFQPLVERLLAQEPVQYIVGETEFRGRRFRVSQSVLIPRPETEELVEWVVQTYQKDRWPIDVLDIGTGSGCIATSLALELPGASVTGWDISPEALAMARANAADNQAMVRFEQVDILDESRWDNFGLFDCVVSNPPYVTRSEVTQMRKNVLEYEPHLALFVEHDDPLLFYRKIAAFCRKKLRPGGCCFVEINEQYGEAVRDAMLEAGLADAEIRKDLFGKDRFVRAGRLVNS